MANANLISEAPMLLEACRERDELLRQCLSCIQQGRVAFDDGQDMTDWCVSAAPLQAALERLIRRATEQEE
jgi:hypothetical protein